MVVKYVDGRNIVVRRAGEGGTDRCCCWLNPTIGVVRHTDNIELILVLK